MTGRSAADAASGLRPFGAEPQDASQAKPLVPNAIITWGKLAWHDGATTPPSECAHDGPDVLTINQRLEPHGNGHRMACDGIVCMRCGSDPLKRLPLGVALARCMDEHGWNRKVGARLYELAEFRRDDLMQEPAIPIWCLDAWGLSGSEIAEALNRQDTAARVEAAA